MKLVWFGAGLVLLLAGCGPAGVYSDNPLFFEPDPSTTLRPGIWLWASEDCAIDTAAPVKQWPDCASPVRVGRQKMGDVQELARAYLISPGMPHILQIRGEEGGYRYEALVPAGFDEAGHVTAVYRTDVPCPAAEEEPEANKTADPDREPEDRCLTVAPDQVVAMARGTLDDDLSPNFRWVRQARADDFEQQ